MSRRNSQTNYRKSAVGESTRNANARTASRLSQRHYSVPYYYAPMPEPSPQSQERIDTRYDRRGSVRYSTQFEDFDDFENEAEGARRNRGSQTPKRSRFEQRKHDAKKRRADKKFDKQFGGADAHKSDEGAPRAAVYQSRESSAHRRANRLQTDKKKKGVRLPAFGSFAIGSSSRSIVGIAVSIMIVFTCAFLYTPAQQYYQSIRENDRLEAEYTAINQRNDELQANVDTLSTSEGMTDYVRDQYGWVQSGENTATVQGIDGSDSNSAAQVNTSVSSEEVKAPETWYSPVLDFIFGVQ
ncbi:MAG: FtsB family cell division protein [Eggerthellaceae bacterium]